MTVSLGSIPYYSSRAPSLDFKLEGDVSMAVRTVGAWASVEGIAGNIIAVCPADIIVTRGEASEVRCSGAHCREGDDVAHRIFL